MNNESCLIIANGHIPENDLIQDLWDSAGVRICADGAIDQLIAGGFREKPTMVIGDGDSISESAKFEFRNTFIRNDDQNTTDTEKCISHAVESGASSIDIIGADGMRVDHTLYNLGLLQKYTKILPIRLWNDYEVIFYKNKSFILEATVGKRISFMPLYESAVVSKSSGLKYPLDNIRLSGSGTLSVSNEISDEAVSIDVESGGFFIFLEY